MIEHYRGHVITEEFQGIDKPPAYRAASTTPSGNCLKEIYGTHQTREAARGEIDGLVKVYDPIFHAGGRAVSPCD